MKPSYALWALLGWAVGSALAWGVVALLPVENFYAAILIGAALGMAGWFGPLIYLAREPRR